MTKPPIKPGFTFTHDDKYRPYGYWLIRARATGERPTNRQNHYVAEAMDMPGYLFTLPELENRVIQVFPEPSRPLVVEVGCYYGHTLTELAMNNPGINFLGVDIKYKRVVKSCQKVLEKQLSNTRVTICDIQDLLPFFPDRSLYGMCIFFPDPWFKNRHEKNRYLSKDFFKLLEEKLEDHGFIWIKTDHKAYHDEVTDSAAQLGFNISNQFPGKLQQRDYVTPYENIFNRQHLPVYQLILETQIR